MATFKVGDRVVVDTKYCDGHYGVVTAVPNAHVVRIRLDGTRRAAPFLVVDVDLAGDRCPMCDAHASEPHDPTCAVGALTEIATLVREKIDAADEHDHFSDEAPGACEYRARGAFASALNEIIGRVL
jgi:hypothetical protein